MLKSSAPGGKSAAPSADVMGVIPQEVAKGLEGSAPTYEEWSEVELPMENSKGILRDYSDALCEELNSIAENERMTPFDAEQLYAYLRMLLKLRVRKVRKSTRVDQSYYNHTVFVVPPFFYLYLENVGVVQDLALGVRISPTFEADDPMEYKDFVDVERHLRRFESFGLKAATVIPRETSGSWDVMSMQVIDDRVRRHDQNAPLYTALLGAMVANEVLQDVLLPRVRYGHVARYRHDIRETAKMALRS